MTSAKTDLQNSDKSVEPHAYTQCIYTLYIYTVYVHCIYTLYIYTVCIHCIYAYTHRMYIHCIYLCIYTVYTYVYTLYIHGHSVYIHCQRFANSAKTDLKNSEKSVGI